MSISLAEYLTGGKEDTAYKVYKNHVEYNFTKWLHEVGWGLVEEWKEERLPLIIKAAYKSGQDVDAATYIVTQRYMLFMGERQRPRK